MHFLLILMKDRILIFVFLPKELHKESGNYVHTLMLEENQCSKLPNGIKNSKKLISNLVKMEKEFQVSQNIIYLKINILKTLNLIWKNKTFSLNNNVLQEFFLSLIPQEMLFHMLFLSADQLALKLSWSQEINQLLLLLSLSNVIS